jgi:hypothetical protein
MYPRLWVPQLRAHILSNFAWNTVLLIVLPIVYVLLPQIVATGHGYRRAGGGRGLSGRLQRQRSGRL